LHSIVTQYFCRLYSFIGYYKIMGIIPCTIHHILAAYLSFCRVCIYSSHTFNLALPLPFFPLVTISLFSISVSRFLFFTHIYLYYFLDSTYKSYLIVSVFFCPTHFTKNNILWVHPYCCKDMVYSAGNYTHYFVITYKGV